jgi:hypothetical protein
MLELTPGDSKQHKLDWTVVLWHEAGPDVEQPVARAKSRARERSTALAYTGRRSDIATKTGERKSIIAGEQQTSRSYLYTQ